MHLNSRDRRSKALIATRNVCDVTAARISPANCMPAAVTALTDVKWHWRSSSRAESFSRDVTIAWAAAEQIDEELGEGRLRWRCKRRRL